MSHRNSLTLSFAMAAALAFAAPTVAATQPGAPSPTHGKQESPLACVPSALAPAERARHFDELGPRLRAIHSGVRELPDGYEFSFPTDRPTYELLEEWIYQERACCPFFDVGLRLDREGGPMWLRLTGREGVKEFIRIEFERWFSKAGAR